MAVLAGKGGEVEIGVETERALAAKYPNVDVAGELLKMHLWLLRNPARRPVRMLVFVEAWLRRVVPARKPNVVTLARRDNISALCGRDDGSAGFGRAAARVVDAAVVCEVPRDLWLENVRNVG